ncbi:MAG: amino acid permease [Spirochaetae bacterium HGW-Spirochaetae-1]|jgi:amino acid transporter|nr:MAG: amino acid permease [Spirochaetae bacterium HGW-Spirochaetae-1]
MKKFGTFKGVFVPSTEAILGTVLFLLLPALTADVGLFGILMVIFLSHTVTVATAFSIADCATNLNNIGGGGMYALSKRSLGLSFGGSIGIQLFIAQAASIGFYCIGFAEPLSPLFFPHIQQMFPEIFSNTDSILLFKQLVATVVLLLFFIIVMFGADFTLKIQMFILVILFGSIAIIFFSPVISSDFIQDGIFSQTLHLKGMRPLTVSLFIITFTQFFPAVTGIDAGVGMSGELADPKKSLVRGTFLSIIITMILYIITVFIFSLMNPQKIILEHKDGLPIGNLLTDLLGSGNMFPYSIFGIIVLLGILFATSSSALSCFMTAPRTAQSLSRDNVLPRFLSFLSKDFRSSGNEPRFAVIFTFLIAFAVIWIGNINTAAMIVGICYLVVYGWVNGSAFLERISQNPTFRPTSRGHWLISFYGYLASLTAIFIFNWQLGLLIIVVQFIIFRLILKYKEEGKLEGVWWGVVYSFLIKIINVLNGIVQGTKNWRPIVTAISVKGTDKAPETLEIIARLLTQYKGFIHFHHILTEKDEEKDQIDEEARNNYGLIFSGDPTETILSMVQMNFYGNLSPNTVLLGYSKKIDTVRVIKKILSLRKNIILLKNGEKFSGFSEIDIWWRGEKNGNLMVLLAYIIQSSVDEKLNDITIRIIRKLSEDEAEHDARDEMMTLLSKARINGEVIILPFTDEDFLQTVTKISGKSNLVLMGIPGNYTDKTNRSLFNLNEFFFKKEIHKYDSLPPVLFVKSAITHSLIE